jgi:hypothetical protein
MSSRQKLFYQKAVSFPQCFIIAFAAHAIKHLPAGIINAANGNVKIQ